VEKYNFLQSSTLFWSVVPTWSLLDVGGSVTEARAHGRLHWACTDGSVRINDKPIESRGMARFDLYSHWEAGDVLQSKTSVRDVVNEMVVFLCPVLCLIM